MQNTRQAEPANREVRPRWSRLGFILAASGSAIGLGNIVFFPGNAYKFGGGGFYLPYFLVLLIVGLPMLILELGLGHLTRAALPRALARTAGPWGEFVGWWALMNTAVIALYYVTILGWVIAMAIGSLGQLWHETVPVDGFTMSSLPNPQGYFFATLSTFVPVVLVILVWLMNAWIVRRGAETIEKAVRLFVPAMWVLMSLLAIRGLTLEGGLDGVWYLFTPDFGIMKDVAVWQGAFCQIFFTLSVGFGVMTAYASYLPPKSDQPANAIVISCLNCGFEVLAGIGIFAILFATSMVPQASTLSMTFFILPQGIAELPGGRSVVIAFGLLFFGLMLLAGLSSSVSMAESLVSAAVDKFAISRRQAILGLTLFGITGSTLFAWPTVVDPALVNNGTLGLTLLDLTDHWVFSYGLLIVGFLEAVLLGWIFGAKRLRESIQRNSAWRLGPWFDALVQWVIPGSILLVMGYALWIELSGGLYGASYVDNFVPAGTWLDTLPRLVPILWLVGSAGLAWLLARNHTGPSGTALGGANENLNPGDRAWAANS